MILRLFLFWRILSALARSLKRGNHLDRHPEMRGFLGSALARFARNDTCGDAPFGVTRILVVWKEVLSRPEIQVLAVWKKTCHLDRRPKGP
jgi:hypothetical protein